MSAEQQVILESNGSRLYGMTYDPAGAPAGAVVICHPLFEERKSAGRVMVELARVLCADGLAVLTFDYRGCGDSAGEFRDYSTPDWIADIRAAVDLMRQHAPACPTGLLGLRLGASLALQVAAERSDIDFIMLWEPVLNGRDHIEQELRKKLMKEMMTFGKGRQTRESLMKTLEQGGEVDFDGYPITSRLYQGLSQLDPAGAAGQFRKRSLVVNITSQSSPSKPAAQLHEALQKAGSASDLRLVNEPPFWNLIGVVSCPSLLRTTRDWLVRTGEPAKTC